MTFDPSIVSNTNKLKLVTDPTLVSSDQTNFPLPVYISEADAKQKRIFDELTPLSTPKKFSIEQNIAFVESQFKVLDTAPIAHWTMDNISGSILVDEKGSYDGTISNMTLESGGKFDDCLYGGDVDSVARSVSVGSIPFKSVSFWVKRKSTTDHQSLLFNNVETAQLSLRDETGSSYALNTYDPTTGYVASNLTVNDTSTWHHIVMVEGTDSGSYWLYLDGVKGSAEHSVDFNGMFDYIGRPGVASGQDVPYFDNMQVYDYKLTDSDILELLDSRSVIALSNPVQLPVEVEDFVAHEESNGSMKYPPAQSATYVKATTQYYTNTYLPYHATDPAKSLTGSYTSNSWLAKTDNITNQKLIIDYGSAKIFRDFTLQNNHNSGGSTNIGVKDFDVYGSNSASFPSTVWTDDTDLELLGSFQARAHISSNVSDPQYFTLEGNTKAYRYIILKIHNNWGHSSWLGLRHIEFKEYIYIQSRLILHTKVPYYSSSIDSGLVLSFDSTQDDNTDYVKHTSEILPTFDPGIDFDVSTTSSDSTGVRVVIGASQLTKHIGKIALQFPYYDTNWSINAVYIGKQATTGDVYDREPGTAVAVTFNGSASTTITSSNTKSDPVDFEITGSDNIVVTFDIVSSKRTYKSAATVTDSGVYNKIGTIGESGNSDVSGFTLAGSWQSFDKILALNPVYEDFQFVSHMSQDPSGAAPQILDSTGYGNHGTTNGAMTSGDLIDTDYGKAIEFDNSSDWIDLPFKSNDTVFTLEFFANAIDTAWRLAHNRNQDGTITGAASFIYNMSFGNGGLVLWDQNSDYYQPGFPETFTPGVYHNMAGVYTGSQIQSFLNGVGGSIGTVAAPLKASSYRIQLASRTNNDSTRYFGGKIKETRISNIARSADWIKLTDAGLRDNVITWQDYASATLLRAILDQEYDLEATHIRQILDQPYDLVARVINELIQLYGFKMLAMCEQYYGDMPKYRQVLDQFYSDFPFVRRLFTASYGDTPRFRQMHTAEWQMPDAMKQTLAMRYSLAEGEVRNIAILQYDLSERDLVRAALDQAYVLAAGDAIVQKIDLEVWAKNGTEIRRLDNIYNINIEQSESTYHMTGELQMFGEYQGQPLDSAEADYQFCQPMKSAWVDPTEIDIIIDGQRFSYLVSSKRVMRGAELLYVIALVSESVLLGHPHSPYSQAAEGMLSGMALDLVEGLAFPVCPVEWRMVNWFIPANRLYVNGESRIELIKRIVNAAGGIVQTSPDNTLVCRPEYPVDVHLWDSSETDLEMADQDDFFSIAPSDSSREGYDRFFISDSKLEADGLRIEDIDITGYKKEVRVYQVPWDDDAEIVLLHSGGPWIRVMRDGVRTETREQQIEIVSGGGKLEKPVYGPVEIGYLQRDLGFATVDEDGTVTTEVGQHSLAKVKYSTKYHRFYVFGDRVEDVQVYPEVISE